MPENDPLTAAELDEIERAAVWVRLDMHDRDVLDVSADTLRRLVAMARRVEGLEAGLREALEIAVIEQDGTKGDDPLARWWADKANRWSAALTPATEVTDAATD